MFSELGSFVGFGLGKFTSPKLLFLKLGFSIVSVTYDERLAGLRPLDAEYQDC